MLSFLINLKLSLGEYSQRQKKQKISAIHINEDFFVLLINLLFSNKHTVFKNSWSHWQEKKTNSLNFPGS